MSKHDHASCEHDVAWCRHCDVAYCQNCDITWTRGPRWNLNQGVVYQNANAAPAIDFSRISRIGLTDQPPPSLTGQVAHAHGGASDGGG